MRKGLVSTIIPVFNRPRMLVEAVESVLVQTYRPLEIIIVDDGSTDETVHVAGKLAAEHNEIRVKQQENGGPGVAREAGRQCAEGEFIQYLDSDDLLLPEKFSLQVSGLREHPECAVAYGKTHYRHRDGLIENGPWKRSGEKIDAMFPSFLESRWWDTPNPLYRTSVCDQAGPWSRLRLEEDWEYDCRIAATGARLCYVPEYVCEVRDHTDHRLCKGEAKDPLRMRQRAIAHQLIYRHAIAAGLHPDTLEMKHFARELFLLCRQCGASGLAEESTMLFELARQASGQQRGNTTMDFRLYRFAARVLGWKTIGKLACLSDRMRP